MPKSKVMLLATQAPAATILIRALIAIVFLTEGILKFVLPDELGVGRFAHIGIPFPSILAPFVGALEIFGGAIILLGLLTRLAALLLLLDITVAIVSTKLPILFGQGFCGFALPKLAHYGLTSMLHEARTDIAMWLGLLFLLSVGAGPFSLDARLSRGAV